jgi:hypothetical protein
MPSSVSIELKEEEADLAGDVRLIIEQVDRPVADGDANAVQASLLDADKVIPDVKGPYEKRQYIVSRGDLRNQD